jgi:cysteine-rich repeat protein
MTGFARRLAGSIGFMSVLMMLSAGSAYAVCGDNVLDTGELCDDGNLVSGDGCDANCTPTGCGNTIVTG